MALLLLVGVPILYWGAVGAGAYGIFKLGKKHGSKKHKHDNDRRDVATFANEAIAFAELTSPLAIAEANPGVFADMQWRRCGR